MEVQECWPIFCEHSHHVRPFHSPTPTASTIALTAAPQLQVTPQTAKPQPLLSTQPSLSFSVRALPTQTRLQDAGAQAGTLYSSSWKPG